MLKQTRFFDMAQPHDDEDWPEFALEFSDARFGAYTVKIIKLPDHEVAVMELPFEEATKLLKFFQEEMGE